MRNGKSIRIFVLLSALLIGNVITLADQSQSLNRSNWYLEVPEDSEGAVRTSLRSAELDSFIVARMATYHVPGLAAVGISNGEIIWTGSYGYANIEENIPVADSTLFMLASISKTFTGLALMQLWEAGMFGLDDPINDYMPIDVINPYYPTDPITFRQLMAHVASLKDNWTVMYSTYCEGDTPIPLDEYVEDYFVPGGLYYSVSGNFNNWAPATHFQYCNHNFVLIGYLVQEITGIPFDQYCNDSVFAPLGMNETSWFLAGLDTSNVAMPYTYSGGTYQPLGQFGYADYPAGALRTSSVQLARHLIAFLRKGEIDGQTVLDSATVDTMLTLHYPHLYSSIGLVWFRNNIGGRWVWRHGGGDQGVSTIASFCPDENSGVVVLTNGESAGTTQAVESMIYTYLTDSDLDGVLDLIDNCPTAANPGQEDLDTDGVGDSCDNCLNIPNPDQGDADYDGSGDLCDSDADDDGWLNELDNCWLNANPLQSDFDGDSVGDACDVCPDLYDPEQWDEDSNGIGDLCDGWIHIHSYELPDGMVGEPYFYQFYAVGGVEPYSWAKLTGQPPVGTLFDGSAGTLSGTPSWAGSYFLEIEASDSDSPPHKDTVSVTITIDEAPFVRGDADGSGVVDIDDVVFLIDYIFAGGHAPDPIDSGDVDCSVGIDIDDVVYLIAFIFAEGPTPGDPNDDGVPDC